MALDFKSIPVSKYFAYVDLMIEKLKRMQLEIPQAHDNRKEISMQQKQAILDVGNAMGWNGGKFQRPTSLDKEVVPDPW
jgi:hypothetical protein